MVPELGAELWGASSDVNSRNRRRIFNKLKTVAIDGNKRASGYTENKVNFATKRHNRNVPFIFWGLLFFLHFFSSVIASRNCKQWQQTGFTSPYNAT